MVHSLVRFDSLPEALFPPRRGGSSPLCRCIDRPAAPRPQAPRCSTLRAEPDATRGSLPHRVSCSGHRLVGREHQAAKESEGPNLWFRRQDMRLPFGDRVFDYVFNLFTSFGYFADLGEHLTVVHNVAQSLKPGGRFVIDYLNVARAENHLVRRRDDRARRRDLSHQAVGRRGSHFQTDPRERSRCAPCGIHRACGQADPGRIPVHVRALRPESRAGVRRLSICRRSTSMPRRD